MKTTFTRMKVAMMFMVRAKLILVFAGMSFALATNALAQKETKHPAGHMHSMPKPGSPQPEPPPPAKLSVPDVEVLDQNGKKQRFYSDLVKDRVVVINFMFTTCTKICPMSGANFSKLQKVLGERLGQNVFLISVTTDPETDSPEKLKAWGEKFNAKAGWTLITGDKETVDGLLRVLTGDGLNKGYHVPSLVIVNDPRKLHRRAYGLEQPDRVVKMVDELAK
jgi:protein SCO1